MGVGTLKAHNLLGFIERCHGTIMVAGIVQFLALSAEFLNAYAIGVRQFGCRHGGIDFGHHRRA